MEGLFKTPLKLNLITKIRWIRLTFNLNSIIFAWRDTEYEAKQVDPGQVQELKIASPVYTRFLPYAFCQNLRKDSKDIPPASH